MNLEEYIQANPECGEGMSFVKRNGLGSLDVSLLGRVEGDYRNFVAWMKAPFTLEYNDDGTWAKEIYRDGRVNEYFYDDNKNRIKEIDYRGRISTFTFDEQGRRASVTGPNGRTYPIEYDSEDNVIFDGKARYEYDDVGNCVRRTSMRGLVTTWRFEHTPEMFTVYQDDQPILRIPKK